MIIQEKHAISARFGTYGRHNKSNGEQLLTGCAHNFVGSLVQSKVCEAEVDEDTIYVKIDFFLCNNIVIACFTIDRTTV